MQMKNLLIGFLLKIAFTIPVLAQESTIFPKGEKAPNINHTGNVWLHELSEADSIFNYSISVATFDAGARLNWHQHPGGQILLILNGTGYYQEKGKTKQTVHKGDVVKCAPGIAHWHGATPDAGVTYLSTTPAQKGRTVWLQKLTDEEYFDGTSLKNSITEKEILNLSKAKWRWMAERKVDSLDALFHDRSVFVHMGANFSKKQELDVISNGNIQYKQADIQETSVQFIGNTAILLNKIRLVAVVGGNEVINPFTVTEVYLHEGGKWKLGSMSFTRLVSP
jgi:4-carboxymuconolactone decarboxylase